MIVRPPRLKTGPVSVDTGTMPDLRKSLGELYGSTPSPTPASPSRRGVDGPDLDDDLAEALSAALVSAPGGIGAPAAAADAAPAVPAAPAPAAPAAPAVGPAPGRPTAPAPAHAQAQSARSRMAGTLREFHRDASRGGPAADAAAPATVAAPAAAAPSRSAAPTVEPLPGEMWRLEDDDILPSGGSAPAVRGIHLTRGRRK